MPIEQLGPYKITRLLGRGGMGAVYEGVHNDSGEHHAIKVLALAYSDDEAFRARFDGEIEALKQLQHPNIVQLIGYGEEDGVMFYSMELVDGENLHDVMMRGDRLTWREVAEIALQVCAALKHAHDHGVIHRDLKPANLLRTPSGIVKLSDFGIARFFGASHITSAGGVIGTADYMAPEQAEGVGITARSDLYSLGAVLYALIAGRPPFPAKTITDILNRARHYEPIPLRQFDPSIPVEFEEILLQLLSRHPMARIATALAVSKQIRAMLHGLDAQTRVEGESPGTSSSGGFVIDSPATKLSPGDVSDSGLAKAESSLDEPAATSLHGTSHPSRGQATERAPVVPATRYVEVDERIRKAISLSELENEPESPWRQRISVGALAIVLIALAIVGWYITRPPSEQKLYAQISSIASLKDIERLGEVSHEMDEYLSQYASTHPEHGAQVRNWQADHEAYRLFKRLDRQARKLGGPRYLSDIQGEFVEAMRSRQKEPGWSQEKLAVLANRFRDKKLSDATDEACVQAAQHLIATKN